MLLHCFIFPTCTMTLYMYYTMLTWWRDYSVDSDNVHMPLLYLYCSPFTLSHTFYFTSLHMICHLWWWYLLLSLFIIVNWCYVLCVCVALAVFFSVPYGVVTWQWLCVTLENDDMMMNDMVAVCDIPLFIHPPYYSDDDDVGRKFSKWGWYSLYLSLLLVVIFYHSVTIHLWAGGDVINTIIHSQFSPVMRWRYLTPPHTWSTYDCLLCCCYYLPFDPLLPLLLIIICFSFVGGANSPLIFCISYHPTIDGLPFTHTSPFCSCYTLRYIPSLHPHFATPMVLLFACVGVVIVRH